MKPWQLVGLLSATATASYLCRVNVTVAGAEMMREFGWTQAQMGRVFSAFLLGYALAQVPAGMLADGWGARRVLAGAAAVWVAATMAIAGTGAGAWSLAALLAARFVLGLGEAPTFPGAAQAVSKFIPVAAQGRANGCVVAAIGLGSAIAPPLVTALMARFGWRVAVAATAAPAALVALVWLRAKRMPEPVEAAADERRGRARLATRSFALLTASYGLQGYVGYIFVFWFYLYLLEVRHFDLLRSAALGSLPWLLSIVSIPAGGWVSDALVRRWGLKWGRRAVPMVGLIGGACFLAVGAGTGNAWVAAVCLALATALVLSVEGPFWASMMEMAGARSGRAGGIMNMGSNAGGFISPALTPVLAASMGWQNALYVAAGLAVAGGLLWLGIDFEGDQSGI